MLREVERIDLWIIRTNKHFQLLVAGNVKRGNLALSKIEVAYLTCYGNSLARQDILITPIMILPKLGTFDVEIGIIYALNTHMDLLTDGDLGGKGNLIFCIRWHIVLPLIVFAIFSLCSPVLLSCNLHIAHETHIPFSIPGIITCDKEPSLFHSIFVTIGEIIHQLGHFLSLDFISEEEKKSQSFATRNINSL